MTPEPLEPETLEAKIAHLNGEHGYGAYEVRIAMDVIDQILAERDAAIKGECAADQEVQRLQAEREKDKAEIERIKRGYSKELWDAEQVLGKALGYPFYKDDPKNFPDCTEANGVCTGEHTTVTLAMEAKAQLAAKDKLLAMARDNLAQIEFDVSCIMQRLDENSRPFSDLKTQVMTNVKETLTALGGEV